MYFVNREKIEEILAFMEKILKQFDEQSFHSSKDLLMLERVTHISAEAIIDVGNMMIDGFIMRDPGSYNDIIDIMMDEKVIPYEEEDSYKQFIQLRKMVVQNYVSVDHQEILAVWKSHGQALKQFPIRIRTYLDNELGPVSAFSKD
ncbi:DUF86 domain-containing protein [Halobacillus rhizosphaerae]|uniref:DUF86 domain-containing protein n=1 Tax=Halobacillus rhizosphaerae TaxID=3064889 RepID=UPI00398B6924